MDQAGSRALDQVATWMVVTLLSPSTDGTVAGIASRDPGRRPWRGSPSGCPRSQRRTRRSPCFGGSGVVADERSHGRLVPRTPLERARPARRDQRHRGEVGGEAPPVAGEEPVAPDGGMGADVEVRQRRLLRPTPAATGEERLARQERRLPGQCLAVEDVGRQQSVEVLDALERDRDLGAGVGLITSRAPRPVRPSASADQSAQSASSVARSTRTLASTRTLMARAGSASWPPLSRG